MMWLFSWVHKIIATMEKAFFSKIVHKIMGGDTLYVYSNLCAQYGLIYPHILGGAPSSIEKWVAFVKPRLIK
jgi:hypothetical protein